MSILIKLIDAKKNLSVQVHSDDAYALANGNSLGKTEMWYVLAARQDSKLVHGFKPDMDVGRVKKQLKQARLGCI